MNKETIYIKMKNGEMVIWDQNSSWSNYRISHGKWFIVENNKKEYIGFYNLDNVSYIEVR